MITLLIAYLTGIILSSFILGYLSRNEEDNINIIFLTVVLLIWPVTVPFIIGAHKQ